MKVLSLSKQIITNDRRITLQLLFQQSWCQYLLPVEQQYGSPMLLLFNQERTSLRLKKMLLQECPGQVSTAISTRHIAKHTKHTNEFES